MHQFTKKIELTTNKQFELVDITARVREVCEQSQIKNGLVVVFCNHTTASVRLNHNEPLLIQDIMQALYRLVPLDRSYNHDLFELREHVTPAERSNGHAHVKSFIFGSSETLLLENGQIVLGEKQSIFFVEFDGGRHRDVFIKVIGEMSL